MFQHISKNERNEMTDCNQIKEHKSLIISFLFLSAIDRNNT